MDGKPYYWPSPQTVRDRKHRRLVSPIENRKLTKAVKIKPISKEIRGKEDRRNGRQKSESIVAAGETL